VTKQVKAGSKKPATAAEAMAMFAAHGLTGEFWSL
jgi:hypothetical protein